MTNEEFQKLILEQLRDIKGDIAKLDTKIDVLEAKVDNYAVEQQKDVIALLQLNGKKLDEIREDVKSVAEITGEHEMKIRSLSRRPV